MIVLVVNDMYKYFDKLYQHDLTNHLPNGWKNFLCNVNTTVERTHSLNREDGLIIGELMIFAKDILLPLYVNFFDKMMEIEKKMPLNDPMHVIDANLALLFKIRKELLTRIYRNNDGSEHFSVALAAFTGLPHVNRWFRNDGGSQADNPDQRIGIENRKEQQAIWAAIVVPSKPLQDYVNGNPLGMLQLYFLQFEEHFYQFVMKDVVTLHVRAVAKQRQQNNNSTEQNGPHSTRSQTSIEEDTEENSKDREKKYYYIAGCCLRVACKQVALQHESKKKVTLKKS